MAKMFSNLMKDINLDTLILNCKISVNINKDKYKINYIGHILAKLWKQKKLLEAARRKIYIIYKGLTSRQKQFRP